MSLSSSTSTSSILLKAFNKHFFEFIEDLSRICPERKEITQSKKYLETMKMANPSLLLKVWYKFISLPYQSQIAEGDLEFFFNKDYKHDLAQMPNSEEILKIVDSTLREPLRNMDEDNKEKCRKYIQLVSTICNKYMEEKGM